VEEQLAMTTITGSPFKEKYFDTKEQKARIKRRYLRKVQWMKDSTWNGKWGTVYARR
jgi:hypothetical protein